MPIAGVLNKGETAQVACAIAEVCYFGVPTLVGFAKWHKIKAFGAYRFIFRFDYGVSRSVSASGFKLAQRLTHGLPSCSPIISCFHIAQVDVAARLTNGHGIGAVAHKSALGSRFEKTVTACIVGNYSPVCGIAKIIAPRLWSVGIGDNILFMFVVEIAVLHFIGELVNW